MTVNTAPQRLELPNVKARPCKMIRSVSQGRSQSSKSSSPRGQEEAHKQLKTTLLKLAREKARHLDFERRESLHSTISKKRFTMVIHRESQTLTVKAGQAQGTSRRVLPICYSEKSHRTSNKSLLSASRVTSTSLEDQTAVPKRKSKHKTRDQGLVLRVRVLCSRRFWARCKTWRPTEAHTTTTHEPAAL